MNALHVDNIDLALTSLHSVLVLMFRSNLVHDEAEKVAMSDLEM